MPAKRKKAQKPSICSCSCPYCDTELVIQDLPFCQVCQITLIRCAVCGAIISDKMAVTCSNCGKPLK